MSGQYEFGLEKVLTFRRIQKDLEVAKLSEEELVLESVQKRLEECRTRIRRLEEEMEAASDQIDLDIKAVIINRSFIRCLREEEAALSRELFSQVAKVDRCRSMVLEKSKDQKIVEKLRERDFTAFVSDNRRREAKETDEMMLLRNGRNVPATF